jgi:hypothetical protein
MQFSVLLDLKNFVSFTESVPNAAADSPDPKDLLINIHLEGPVPSMERYKVWKNEGVTKNTSHATSVQEWVLGGLQGLPNLRRAETTLA